MVLGVGSPNRLRRGFGGQEGLDYGYPEPRVNRQRSRRYALNSGCDRGDVVGSGSTTSTNDVREAGRGEVTEELASLVGLFVVLAERVRQAGVRVAAHVTLSDARELRHVGTHIAGAEGAVDPDAERLRMADGNVKSIERLP